MTKTIRRATRSSHPDASRWTTAGKRASQRQANDERMAGATRGAATPTGRKLKGWNIGKGGKVPTQHVVESKK